MLAGIVSFALQYRGVVLTLAAALLVYGVAVLRHAPIDVFPDFAPPHLTVQTEAPGLSPREVEQLVTRPLETALAGTVGVADVASRSIAGVSVIHLVFGDGTDVYRDRQLAAERLAQAAGELPAGTHAPVIGPLNSPAQTVMVIGLEKPGTATNSGRLRSTNVAHAPLAPHELVAVPGFLRALADWTVRPPLQAVAGVSSVTVYGGRVAELQIQPDAARMRALGVTLADLLSAARSATGVVGAAFADTPSQRVLLQIEGQPTTAAGLADALVRSRGGIPLRIGDVARVVWRSAPPLGAASIRGRPAVILMIDNQLGSNTVTVSAGIDAALDDLQPGLTAEGVTLHRRLFRPARFVRTAVRGVTGSLELGAVLVTVVLLVILSNLRVGLISLTAIPLSLVAGALALVAAGVTLNTMTLGGLAIAIGEVVDDAIIDVENIFRRLHENPSAPVDAVILGASLEVRSAVVYATFVVILVFTPVLLLSGLQGRLFGPLALAYIAAVLASLGVALTVTPALASFAFQRGARGTHRSPVLDWMRGRYEPVLARTMRWPGAVLAAVIGLTAAALCVLPFLGVSLLPQFQEGHVIVHMNMLPGTSPTQSLALGREVTRVLLADPDVAQVSQRAGRAENSDDVTPPENSELDVDLKSAAAAGAGDRIMRRLADVPGATFAVRPFLTERIEETLSSFTGAVAVEVFGQNLGTLDALARQVLQVVSATPGAVGPALQTPLPTPRRMLRLEPGRLLAFGLRPGDVMAAVHAAWQGVRVAQIYRGSRAIDVRVILPAAERRDPERAGSLLLDGPGGTRIPLSAVATAFWSPARSEILHDGGRRRQVVTCDVRGRDVASFDRDLQTRLRALRWPSGTYVTVGGEGPAAAAAARELLRNCALAALGVVVLLGVALRRMPQVLLVLLNLPFALIGGVAAVLVLGGTLTLGTMVGFVTLFGITMRNAIMLISHYEHLVKAEGAAWGRATALRGARERLGPIVMTALVTGLGLLPMALGSGAPGREIDGPMACVILGGLFTSTALTLLVLPTLALRYGDWR